MKNPHTDPDKAEIWEMLMERDFIAFCSADWILVQDDFIEESFLGMDGGKFENPDQWKVNFPDLASYKKEWLRQAEEFRKKAWIEDPVKAWHALTDLSQIDIVGDTALAHKKFDGYLTEPDGTRSYKNWQTLYQCRKQKGRWKIFGFLGYLPYPLGTQSSATKKKLPEGASQHSTAGPYSPVLEIDPGKLVVISGQAAINKDGKVVGETIEEQTQLTLENCRCQLAKAQCTFDHVFKVNVYLKDLADWPRFNAIYESHFNDPKPVRTAVQTPLLLTLLVEVEMWAVR